MQTYPMDPITKVVRDGSRFNEVLVARFDPSELADATRAHSAEGVVAYSAICTHMGCPLSGSGWLVEKQTLKCYCHYSEFDLKDGARVMNGPARRRLPTLPLKIADGILMVAGGFLTRVGYKPKTGGW